MFNNSEQMRKFINGDSFVTEEKVLKVENTTKKEVHLRLVHFDSVESSAPVLGGSSTQTTIPNVSIRANKNKSTDFSKLIKDFRSDFKLTQPECADIIGISLGTIQNIESNSFNRNRDTTLKLITALELGKTIKKNVQQKYILRSVFHSKMGLFGNRTAIEFVNLLPPDRRLNELAALLKKIYE